MRVHDDDDGAANALTEHSTLLNVPEDLRTMKAQVERIDALTWAFLC
ncbi:hypothetical protein [Saccharopolyspora gloriosae]|nr:hypothetical protein [Saccharopolyspora gloriosae]